MKRIANSERRQAEIKCDAIASRLCRFINHDKCAGCNGVATESHHILTRSDKRLRHSMFNLLPLCRICHDYAHANPKLFKEWTEENFSNRLERARIALRGAKYRISPLDTLVHLQKLESDLRGDKEYLESMRDMLYPRKPTRLTWRIDEY